MGKKMGETVSRRVFLANTGKLVGFCVLSHFAMVGKAEETFSGITTDNGPSKAQCKKAYVCEDQQYSCDETDTHSCAANQFSCGTGFTCKPTTANTTNDKCVPVHAQTE